MNIANLTNCLINIIKKRSDILDEIDDDLKSYISQHIYLDALNNKTQEILNNNNYLVEINDIDYKSNKQMIFVMENLSNIINNPNVCIAGGFPTRLYFEQNLDNSKYDIDIFIFEHANYKQTLTNIFNSIKYDFNIFASNDMENAVYDIIDNNMKFNNLQIIGTKCKSVAELFNTFDASYCKCAIYQNKLIVSPDAIYSKNTKKTTFNLTKIKNEQHMYARFNKALSYNLIINNYEYYKFTNVDNNYYINRNFKRTIEGCINNFTFINYTQYDIHIDHFMLFIGLSDILANKNYNIIYSQIGKCTMIDLAQGIITINVKGKLNKHDLTAYNRKNIYSLLLDNEPENINNIYRLYELIYNIFDISKIHNAHIIDILYFNIAIQNDNTIYNDGDIATVTDNFSKFKKIITDSNYNNLNITIRNIYLKSKQSNEDNSCIEFMNYKLYIRLKFFERQIKKYIYHTRYSILL